MKTDKILADIAVYCVYVMTKEQIEKVKKAFRLEIERRKNTAEEDTAKARLAEFEAIVNRLEI